MNQFVHTPPAEPDAGEALDGLDNSASVSASDVLNRLWRFFISMRTGLVLILGLGLLSLVGTLLAQAPSGMRGDPQAYASWLDSMRPRYGGWTPVLDTLGFFSIFSSIWFKAVTVLLTTSILACSVNRAPRLWRLAVHPRTRMGETFFTHAPLRAEVLVPADPDQAIDDVRAVFRSHRFRTITDPDDDVLHLYADRFRWGPFGTVLAHVSFVVILLGALLSASTGFKDTQFTAPVGSRVPVGHGTGLSVEARSFSDDYYPDGAPKDYASDLVLYQNGAVVDRQTVRVNQPMSWDGVSFYQSFFGVAAAMQVKDGAGKILFDQGVPLVWSSDDGTHSIGQFALAGNGLSVYVIGAASGSTDVNIKAGQMQLEVLEAGTKAPIATEVVSQGKPTTIAGLTYTFVRPVQFTGLIVAHDPGAVFVWVGSTLLVSGLFLVFFFPHRRVWVRVRKIPGGSQIRCASTRRRDLAFEPRFHQLVTDIQLASTPSSTTHEVGQNDA
ncbi:MAG: cytochrome c biogenesis protein ResB [Actinomycetes bacterium]